MFIKGMQQKIICSERTLYSTVYKENFIEIST